MNKFLLYFLVIFLFGCHEKDTKIFQFRGDMRDGIFHEENLLKIWPESGPKLLWVSDSIGNGYGSPTITEDRIYITGEIDSIGYMFAYDFEGKELWRSAYGKEWMQNFTGSRSAPTVVGKEAYVLSGVGELACFNAENGEQIWHLNTLKDLHGKNSRFGYSQALVVNDDVIYCAPGGRDTNFVALDRFTGAIRWISNSKGEYPTHCSPRLVTRREKQILYTYSQFSLIALDASNGELLWSHPVDTLGYIHSNTPLVEGDYLYSVTGAGNFGEKFKINEDGTQYELIWQNKSMDNVYGGFVKTGKYMVSTGARKRYLKCLDTESGEVTDSLKIGTGNIIYADSLYYMYNERGKMYLIGMEKGKLSEISSFKVDKGSREHFAHPAIKDGVLYMRHGNILLAYDIKEE